MKKIILDVDTGIDDALGIILAVKSKKFDIVGITTTNGNVTVDRATENTLKVLHLLGCHSSIPVYQGASRPLLRKPVFEHRVHGEDGLGGALPELLVEKRDSLFAPDFMIDTILQHKHDISLIMTAPLTNLALALQKNPQIVNYVNEVIVMGGVVRDYGNITPTAEYNMFVDPEAAKIVFHSGLPITLVGLDVTRKVLLTERHIQKLKDPKVQHFVRTSTAHYIDRYYRLHGIKACALHDPLAVGVALDRDLVQTQKMYVDIETRSELCDGQTVCDFQNRLNLPPNIEVCLDVNTHQFMDMFINSLNLTSNDPA